MPRYSKKRTTRKRTTRRKVTRRKNVKKMTAKRVKAISATKKKDHIMSGVRNAGEFPKGDPVQYLNINMNGDTWMFLHSPSYIPWRDASTPYGRNSNRIHHTSYAERMELDIGFPVSVEHRRIVFSNMYEDERAVVAQYRTTQNDYTSLRNITSIPPDAFKDLFQGTQSVDWYSYLRAPMDKKKVTVHYDNLRTYTPLNSLGKVFNRKFYHKINKHLSYADAEYGNDQGTERNWPGIKSPKLFIMDLFRSLRNTEDPVISPGGGQYMALSFEGTNYWTEP